MLYTIYGDRLYTLDELAKAGNISVSTIRRWILSRDLIYFLTVYVDKDKKQYYKLGLPYDDDKPYEDSDFKYILRKGVASI